MGGNLVLASRFGETPIVGYRKSSCLVARRTANKHVYSADAALYWPQPLANAIRPRGPVHQDQHQPVLEAQTVEN
jgi:hypothetical protein